MNERPTGRLQDLRDRVDSYLMSVVPQLLRVPVIRVLVRQKERPANRTAVPIRPVLHENLLIDFPVLIVDGIIEGQDDHLRRLIRSQVAGNAGRVHGAEAVRQGAIGEIASAGSVWILLWIAV